MGGWVGRGVFEERGVLDGTGVGPGGCVCVTVSVWLGVNVGQKVREGVSEPVGDAVGVSVVVGVCVGVPVSSAAEGTSKAPRCGVSVGSRSPGPCASAMKSGTPSGGT